MLVSFITSVYNEEENIKEMIQSLIDQTYQFWELIIVDDNSSDNTWKIINSFNDTRILSHKNTKNEGLTKNLNYAIAIAKGKYILRIDGDDIAYPTRIEKQLEYMEKYPNVVVSGCNMRAFGDVNEIFISNCNTEYLKFRLLFSSVIYHPTFIIRNSTLKKYNIKYDEKLRYAQDYGLLYTMSKYGDLGNIPNVLMKYRKHSKQISVKNLDEQTECANQIRRIIIEEFGLKLKEYELKLWCDFASLKKRLLNKLDEKKLLEFVEYMSLKIDCKFLDDIYSMYHLFLDICTKEKKINQNKMNIILKCMMANWVQLSSKTDKWKCYLESKQIFSVAVYGVGILGKQLIDDMKKEDINISYVIDQKAYTINNNLDIPIFNTSEMLPPVDMIIISPIEYYEEIKNDLLKTCDFKTKIVSIEDVIYSM